jgi:hypothetical protein
MDDIQRGRIRLEHWIDHNVEHLKGYEEVATTLEKEGLQSVGGKIRQGIHLIQAANREFQEALAQLSAIGGQSATTKPTHHTHSHAHDGGHEHAHHHSQEHGHSHEDKE